MTNEENNKATSESVECNRSVCNSNNADWWNISTHAFYCKACAREINKGCDSPICIAPSEIQALLAALKPVNDEDLVEEVARAICYADGVYPDAKISIAEDYWENYKDHAKAALSIIRKPIAGDDDSKSLILER